MLLAKTLGIEEVYCAAAMAVKGFPAVASLPGPEDCRYVLVEVLTALTEKLHQAAF